MSKLKTIIASILVISTLSTSGCMLFDPFWWGDGPHHGGGGGGGPGGGGPGGGPGR